MEILENKGIKEENKEEIKVTDNNAAENADEKGTDEEKSYKYES